MMQGIRIGEWGLASVGEAEARHIGYATMARVSTSQMMLVIRPMSTPSVMRSFLVTALPPPSF